jgi:hypothetical protein
VAFLEQILQLPYAYAWLPAIVFFVIVGGIYWLTRPLPALKTTKPAEDPAFVQMKASEKPKDQRFAYRRHGNPVQVYIKSTGAEQEPALASILDRSVGGVRMAIYQEVEVGGVFAIRPINADDMVPWVEIEVRSCQPSSELRDQFEVGCQYVKSPPYSIQLLFG